MKTATEQKMVSEAHNRRNVVIRSIIENRREQDANEWNGRTVLGAWKSPEFEAKSKALLAAEAELVAEREALAVVLKPYTCDPYGNRVR
jgi:hypothetical protein